MSAKIAEDLQESLLVDCRGQRFGIFPPQQSATTILEQSVFSATGETAKQALGALHCGLVSIGFCPAPKPRQDHVHGQLDGA